ncbi:MAG: Gfo/Idh/MocA family oxidoreductase [Verrucomicrobia bacterium]|nr:Gfo/Idh/MocA family oxidoreductase [Verrucomicrobiota bacterium]MCF7708939.1 Gfo/Idh/MocA family oxidoreductase [Verrucomicrobiota bacterium]
MSNKNLSRRSFLKKTSVITAGFMIADSGTLVRGQSPNEKLNIACIGIGGRGRANLNAVSRENIVALCDVDDKRAGNAFEKYSKAKKYKDFRRMFDEMSDEIDAVVVSTPDHTHFHPSIWALERGKHLYCEKPMAHNVWEVRQMTDFAREKGLVTQLGVQRHTHNNIHRVVEIIRSGAIGDVKEVHAWVGGRRGMPDDPKEFPPVPEHLDWELWLGPAEYRKYSPAYCPYNWRFWWDFGTGETGNWGCHILDIPFWALGLRYPTLVEASGPEVHPEKTPTSLSSKIEFPKRGKRNPVTLYWSHGTPSILKEKNLDGGGANNVFVGTEGTLVCGFGSRKLYPENKFKDFVEPDKSIPDSPGFHKEWTQAIKGGKPPTCNFNYSGPLTEAVLLANTAYRAEGKFDWNAQTLDTSGNDNAQALIRETFRKGWKM